MLPRKVPVLFLKKREKSFSVIFLNPLHAFHAVTLVWHIQISPLEILPQFSPLYCCIAFSTIKLSIFHYYWILFFFPLKWCFSTWTYFFLSTFWRQRFFSDSLFVQLFSSNTTLTMVSCWKNVQHEFDIKIFPIMC